LGLKQNVAVTDGEFGDGSKWLQVWAGMDSNWGCAESDENFGYRFSKNRTEPTSKFKNRKLGFHGSVFKKPTSAVWGWFFTPAAR